MGAMIGLGQSALETETRKIIGGGGGDPHRQASFGTPQPDHAGSDKLLKASYVVCTSSPNALFSGEGGGSHTTFQIWHVSLVCGEENLVTGKYGCTEVRVYPAECGEQLGTDPSKIGSSKSLVLKSFFFWGGNTLGLIPASLPHTLGYACTFYAPTSPPPKKRGSRDDRAGVIGVIWQGWGWSQISMIVIGSVQVRGAIGGMISQIRDKLISS